LEEGLRRANGKKELANVLLPLACYVFDREIVIKIKNTCAYFRIAYYLWKEKIFIKLAKQ
jgi:hypothetical protein